MYTCLHFFILLPEIPAYYMFVCVFSWLSSLESLVPRCRGCSALEDADAAVAEVLAEWRCAFGKADAMDLAKEVSPGARRARYPKI